MPIAAVEAMKRFEGPKKGIRLNPKATKKVIINSMINAMPCSLFYPFKNKSLIHTYKHKQIEGKIAP
jgi:hypothetical protein